MTTDTFERLSKSATLLLLAIYTVGFLIISLHHSAYGFTDLNPLRPRILAAGTWFSLMVGSPAYLIVMFAPRKPNSLSLSKWLFAFCLAVVFLQNSFSWVFSSTPTPAAPPNPHWWWELLRSLLPFVVLYPVSRSTKMPGAVVAIANLLLFAWLVWGQSNGARHGRFDMGAVGLWFLGVGLLTYFVVHAAAIPKFDWSSAFIFVLGGLLLFGTTYYPHIKSKWGGGESTPVVVYMSKDSPLKPSQQIQASLIDESDGGYYFVPKNETKALFLPRSAVSLLFFGEQTKDSQLLSSQPSN